MAIINLLIGKVKRKKNSEKVGEQDQRRHALEETSYFYLMEKCRFEVSRTGL